MPQRQTLPAQNPGANRARCCPAHLQRHGLLHARRNFIDVNENFPEESRQVIESLREIYRFEAQAKERKLSPLERLAFDQALTF